MGGSVKKLLVHRKGATRAFPPHHPLIPVDYQVAVCCRCRSQHQHPPPSPPSHPSFFQKFTGQPVLVGGTMGTCRYNSNRNSACICQTHNPPNTKPFMKYRSHLPAAMSSLALTKAWQRHSAGSSPCKSHARACILAPAIASLRPAADAAQHVPRCRPSPQPQQEPQCPRVSWRAFQRLDTRY